MGRAAWRPPWACLQPAVHMFLEPPLRNHVLQGGWACFLSESMQICCVLTVGGENPQGQPFCGSQLFFFLPSMPVWVPPTASITTPAASASQLTLLPCNLRVLPTASLLFLPASHHQVKSQGSEVNVRSLHKSVKLPKFGFSYPRHEKIGPDNTLSSILKIVWIK